MDPITLGAGIAALLAWAFSSGCVTLSKEEREGGEPVWKGLKKEQFTVKGPCISEDEYMAPADMRETIAQMKAQSYATNRALLLWLTQEDAGKLCRGKIIDGGISTKSYFSFQTPVEICSDGESPRGVVDVTSFGFTCSKKPCSEAWIKSTNNIISACIPPGVKVE